jgi:DMSO/TMAO reductase YedYZ molybdopterin-dependent catalytic subunit
LRLPTLLVTTLIAAALQAAHVDAQPAAPDSLVVKGNVERQITLSLADLRQLPVQRVEDARVVRDAAAPANASETARHYTGCLLRDVLDRAKPVEKQRMDLRKSIVVITAADGYRAIFSWAELYLSPIGDGALVVYERDGQALAASEGPLALVSLKDTRPGPRHVKWLSSVELRLVTD